MYLEREIKARMDQAASESQPHQRNKTPTAVYASGEKPAQHYSRKGQGNQRAADPAESDACFQPVVVQLRIPIGPGGNPVELGDGLKVPGPVPKTG